MVFKNQKSLNNMSIKIGKDDFCSNCMEWREYDEEGRCKVCGKIPEKKVISYHQTFNTTYKTGM